MRIPKKETRSRGRRQMRRKKNKEANGENAMETGEKCEEY